MNSKPLPTSCKFFVRTFPCVRVDWECIKIEKNKTVIYVRSLQDLEKDKTNPKHKPKYWRFTTEYVLQKCSQRQVYDKLLHDVVNESFLGIDCVIMSYGQTYSGKTYTTLGFDRPELEGYVPRLITDIFKKKATYKPDQVTAFISVVEVCGEIAWDLLMTPATPCERHRQVKHVVMRSEEQTRKLLNKTLTKRGVIKEAPYGANRGALVVTYHINVTNIFDCKPVVVRSKLHCVDLPGTETIGRNELTCFKDRASQGKANLYKTFVEQIVLSLKEKTHGEVICYRSHGLIEYLGKSLTTKSNLRFVGHIRPTHEDIPLTVSTLRLGTHIQRIKDGTVEPEVIPIPDVQLQELRCKVAQLETEIMKRKLIYNEDPIDNMTQAHLELLRESVIEYTKGNTTEFHLMSIVDAPVVFEIFKELFLEKESGYKTAEKTAVCLALEDLKRQQNYAMIPVSSKTEMLKELAELSAKIGEDLHDLISSEQIDTEMHIAPASVEGSTKTKKQKLSLKKNSQQPKLSNRQIDVRVLQEDVMRIEYLLACIYRKPSLITEFVTDRVDEAIFNIRRNRFSIFSRD